MSEEEDAGSSLNVPALLVPVYYIISFMIWLIILKILEELWPHLVLLNFEDLEGPAGISVWNGVGQVWFIFLWGACMTLLLGWLSRNNLREHDPLTVLFKGWWISLNAGVFEELIYRWLVFFCAMFTLPFINFITFGLLRWFYTEALIPIANWSTLGALEPQLLGHPEWVFGAALVSASVKFRDAHEHLGLLGWINSWFLGMIMFYLMFNYGILTAILAHVLYDVVVFTAAAIATSWQSNNPYSLFFSYRR